MKKIVLIIYIIWCISNNVFSQGNTLYPIGDKYIPVWNINNENITIKYPGNIHLGSTQAGMLGIGDFSIEGNSDVTIKANAINFKNTHIGSNDPNFKVHANIQSLKLASNYNYANSTSGNGVQVPLYEKIEFGIELPEEIQDKINLFLNSNSSAADPNHPGLNPYDPQDISVEATVTGTLTDPRYIINQQDYNESLPSSVTVYGFYYQEATPTSDLTSWTVNTATPYPFRVRMAPPYKGTYHVTFKVTYWDNGSYTTIDFAVSTIGPNQNYGGTMSLDFEGVENTSGKAIAKGYIKVGKHKRHLRHSYDNTSFFPIGMNVPELPEHPTFSWDFPSPVHKYTPWGYQTRRNLYFSSLASNHGNFVRLISFSDVNAIERTCGSYEYHVNDNIAPQYPETGHYLGNYQVNQKHMQETDNDITKMEELGIFTNFCLQIHFPFETMNNSWVNDDWEHNAYRLELGLNNVKDFFSNPNAQRFFKHKLRYAQARWGYSAAIGMWQLASEISQFGIVGIPGKGPYFHDSQYYDNDHVQKLYDWQCTMTDNIKSIYPNHLTNTCYALNPFDNYSGSLGNNPACEDKSFTCPNMDIISWNYYNYDALEDINRSRFDAVTNVIYNTDNVDCGMDPAGYFIDKPLLFTEVGTNKDSFITDNSPKPEELALGDYTDTVDLNIDGCTDIEVHNQMWAGAMSGELGTPLEWHNNTDINALNTYFSNFNALSSFFDDIDFETHKYRPCVSTKKELIDKGGNIFTNQEMDLEIYVMANDNSGIVEKSDRGFGWVNHIKGNWQNQTQGFMNGACNGTPSVFPGFIDEETYNYKLNGFKSGNYLIDVYDTRTGNIIHSSTDNNEIHASIANILTLGIPHVELYKTPYTQVLDYAFKFWHASVNGNDLRIIPPQDSSNNKNTSVILPGDNDDLKKYFLVDYYPNPSTGNITIVASGELIKSISLIDLAGKELQIVNNLNSTKIEFTLSDVATGLYHLRITSNTGISKIFKLVKQ